MANIFQLNLKCRHRNVSNGIYIPTMKCNSFDTTTKYVATLLPWIWCGCLVPRILWLYHYNRLDVRCTVHIASKHLQYELHCFCVVRNLKWWCRLLKMHWLSWMLSICRLNQLDAYGCILLRLRFVNFGVFVDSSQQPFESRVVCFFLGSLQHKVSKNTLQNQMEHGKMQWQECWMSITQRNADLAAIVKAIATRLKKRDKDKEKKEQKRERKKALSA